MFKKRTWQFTATRLTPAEALRLKHLWVTVDPDNSDYELRIRELVHLVMKLIVSWPFRGSPHKMASWYRLKPAQFKELHTALQAYANEQLAIMKGGQ
jgi:hypothetical protein